MKIMKKLNFRRTLALVGVLCAFTGYLSAKPDVLGYGKELNNQNNISSKISGDNIKRETFKIGNGCFLLNDEPFLIKAAELHYPRIPMEYWDQRIKMCKALGMNTICLYTFWNVHETNENLFSFEGQNDIRKFILLCQEKDMKVILRPGPYVCAEWEMGGIPWWLLKKKDISLRDSDPYFLERVEIFEEELSKQVKDLTIENGGPILMIQVENEYGAYGINKPYISSIRDMLRKFYGDNIIMFQCDWNSNFVNNGLDDLVWTMNFGTGADIDNQFEELKKQRPESPLMCSEFWSGWFDKWGAAHETRPAKEMIEGIDEMLSKNISFSLYMAHGGTNWGHWAGANSPGYAPDVTSYDYDAPINEQGNITEKYLLLRDVLQKYSNDELPPIPDSIPTMKIPNFYAYEIADLWENLPEPLECNEIKTMEEFNQGYGSIMYSTILPDVKNGTLLHVVEPHDYAQVFVNGEYIGKLDRRYGETEIALPACHKGDRLDILVEAMGRINFGVAIKDFKGITDKVYLSDNKDGENSVEIFDSWKVYLFPDELSFYESFQFNDIKKAEKKEDRYPRGLYKGKFYVEKPEDTFLLFETWGKGLVYVNGHGLGRFWEIGPQQTLYTPGSWLKEGENEILIFDIVGPKEYKSEGLVAPIIDKLQGEALEKNRSEVETLDLGNLTPVYGGAFPEGNGWKIQTFKTPAEGKYLVIEVLSPYLENDFAAIAEFYLLDGHDHRLSRENWKVVYVDSEDTTSGNNTAEKIFDLQESTFWKSESSSYPQRIVIDLGKREIVGGIEYLPRMENGAPGAIKEYRIFVTDEINLDSNK